MQLDDSILKTIETDDADELKESRDLIKRIRRRDLYQVFLQLIFKHVKISNWSINLVDLLKFFLAVLQ